MPVVSHRLSAAVMSMAVVVAVAQLVAGLCAWSAQDTLVAAARQGVRVQDVSTVYGHAAQLAVYALLVSYVVTCLWLRRARQAAVVIAPAVVQRRAAPWIWLGWLIPVVNFWFPYQVVRDVRRASAGPLGPEPSLRPLTTWWVAWVVWLLFDQVANRLVPSAGVPDERLVSQLGWVEQVVTVALLVATAAWLRLVREIATLQATSPTRLARPVG